MSTILFGRGAKGRLVEELQLGLGRKGHPLAKIDGDYGQKTQEAVRAFQAAKGEEPTGSITRHQWTDVTNKPVPSLAERCLQLTAAFEGHNYTLAVGNFDGALLTWGVIGFTLKHGEIQKIVQGIQATAPHLVTQAFGANAPELLRMMSATEAEQAAWANGITVGGGKLAEPWRSAFATFGGFPEVQAIQNTRAHENYFTPALRAASSLGLTTERGVALCFDIHVQNGGIKQRIREGLTPLAPGQPEEPLLKAIANAVANSAREAFREDVRSRKMTIATGEGTVHGKQYDLVNWGLATVSVAVV